MKRKAFFKKILRYQQTDAWCGPAAIQMVLAAGGIRKTQKEIAKNVSHYWWGTTQQLIFAYLSKYYSRLNFKENTTFANVTYHLKKKHIIMVNWFDDDPARNIDYNATNEFDYGHYSLLIDYDTKKRRVTLLDPSESNGFRQVDVKKFKQKWYDYLDVYGQRWLDGWMLWVDTDSKIKGV